MRTGRGDPSTIVSMVRLTAFLLALGMSSGATALSAAEYADLKKRAFGERSPVAQAMIRSYFNGVLDMFRFVEPASLGFCPGKNARFDAPHLLQMSALGELNRRSSGRPFDPQATQVLELTLEGLRASHPCS